MSSGKKSVRYRIAREGAGTDVKEGERLQRLFGMGKVGGIRGEKFLGGGKDLNGKKGPQGGSRMRKNPIEDSTRGLSGKV